MGNVFFKILIVDDSSIIRAGLRTMLTELNGIEIVGEAVSGDEAVKMVKEYEPDLVILDLQIPNLSGLEVLKFIKHNYPKIRAFVITNKASANYKEKSFALGCDLFLDKSSEFGELSKVISLIVEARRRK